MAAWEAVLSRGLHPICLSAQKLYGTWDDPEPVQEELLAMARERTDCHLSVQHAAGHRIIRLKAKGMRAPAFPPSRHYTDHAATVVAEEPATEVAAAVAVENAVAVETPADPPVSEVSPSAVQQPHQAPQARRRPAPGPGRHVRRIALDLLPPVVTRAIRRARAAKRSAAG